VLSPAVDDLKRKRPEWTPWLTLVHEALAESGNRAWDAVVPDRPSPPPGVPALSGTTMTVPTKLARGLFERLASAAARGGTPRMAEALEALRRTSNPGALFQASITQDLGRLDEIDPASRVNPDALQAVLGLLALPLLQACTRQWSAPDHTPWTEGYCRTCGSWPAFAEMRGVDRSRFQRCGRCGGEWYSRILHCTYCRTTTHDEMVALVPQAETNGVIEACNRCGGYLKVFTRLQGCAPAAVMLADLASVSLDLAALEAGYRRPAGAGRPPAVAVHVTTGRRFLAWNT
jgi:FdhE protein